MSKQSGKVIEQTRAGQPLEVVEKYRCGDNSIWSRYPATESSATPISSLIMYFTYAIGFALVLFGIGCILAHRIREPIVFASENRRE